MAELSGRSLKAANYAWAFVYAMAHVVAGYFVLVQNIPSVEDFKQVGALLGGSAVGAVFAVIFVELIGGPAKARLVHLRWNEALPGHRAFTIHIHEDERIDKARLNARRGPLPSAPREQNALWYRLLQANGANPAVSQAHALYLLFRDLTWISLLQLIFAAVVSLRAPAPITPTSIFLLFLAAELLTMRYIAARASVYLVKTVLAIEAAKED